MFKLEQLSEWSVYEWDGLQRLQPDVRQYH